MSKRRTHSLEFKARVAMEAIRGRKTLKETDADHTVHSIHVSQWKKQLLEGASEFPHRRKSLTPLRLRCNGLGGKTAPDC